MVKKAVKINKTAGIAMIGSALCCLVLLACLRQSPRECDRYRSFFDLSISEEHGALNKYPLEEQVAICMCGMYREPPAMYLARTLAQADGQLVPPLEQRLRTEKDEAGQRNIVYVFSVLSDEGHLRGRQDVIDEIRLVVSNMKDELLRKRSQVMLAEIEANMNKE